MGIFDRLFKKPVASPATILPPAKPEPINDSSLEDEVYGPDEPEPASGSSSEDEEYGPEDQQPDRWLQRNREALALERDGNVEEAIELYKQNVAENSEIAKDYERLIIIYGKRKDFKEALYYCDLALNSPCCTGTPQDTPNRNFQERKKKLELKLQALEAKEKGEPDTGYAKDFPYAVPHELLKTSEKGKAKYQGQSGSDLTGEQAALEWYKANGYNGLWSENLYWWTLLTLLYWDVIYMRIRYYYEPENHSQHLTDKPLDMPADLFIGPAFYERRKTAFYRHTAWLMNADLSDVISNSYQYNYGKPARLIEAWDRFTLEELLMAPGCLRNEQITRICARILADLSQFRAGLPDLFLVKDGVPLFSEVKTMREKVDDGQKGWHDFLTNEVGAIVEIFLIKPVKGSG